MTENITFTHQDYEGRVKMVDVGQKQPTMRRAIAFSSIWCGEKIVQMLLDGSLAKGDAWAATRVAGIMAAKKTSELIPLTHPIRLDSVRVDLFALNKERIGCFVCARAFDRTGVEMEAMVGASAAMLNLYDMVKGVDKGVRIENTFLVHKFGGKSGDWVLENTQTGKFEKFATSKGKGTPKDPCDEINLKVSYGVEGDAHGGDWHRQVSLLGVDSIKKMKDQGLDVNFGSFAENMATSGVCLYELPVGTLMYCPDSGVVMQVTQIGKECHTKCAVYYKAGDCVMPKEGIFTIVLNAGPVKVSQNFFCLPHPI